MQEGGMEEEFALSAGPVAGLGEWHHVALVSDGATGTLFVDGQKVAGAPLGPSRAAAVPAYSNMIFGQPERYATWSLHGDLDDARVWRRAVPAREIAALARSEAPPRFALTRSTCVETDDLTALMRAEFGAEARLADWDDLKRFHADAASAWADEMGFTVSGSQARVLRGGSRRYDERRHYFINRFDGKKPAYYLAHDEFGGMTIALGSWYGSNIPLLVALPPTVHRQETLTADATGIVRREGGFGPAVPAWLLSWKAQLDPQTALGVQVDLRLRDGRHLAAICRPAGAEAMALALGDVVHPPLTRETPAVYGREVEFALVLAEGALRFRAVSVVGGNPIFEEKIALPRVRPAEVIALELRGLAASGSEGAKRGLASATLFVE